MRNIRFTIIPIDVERLRLTENSIALGNKVATELKKRDVPIEGGIVPWFKPGQFGKIGYEFHSDGSIEVLASYDDLDDNEL